MLACGEREALVMALPLCVTQQYRLASMAAWISSTGFPTSLLPHTPLDLSLCGHQQSSPLDCSTIPKLQLPVTAPSRGPVCLSRVYMEVARTAWFSFYLGCHRSSLSLSALNVSPLTQTIAPIWGWDPCLSSPIHQGQVQSYKHSYLSPNFLCPTEFCVGIYILFSWSGTRVHDVQCILMYQWREMYSTSTYSSAIFFSNYFPHFYPDKFYNSHKTEVKCQISLLLNHSARIIQTMWHWHLSAKPWVFLDFFPNWAPLPVPFHWIDNSPGIFQPAPHPVYFAWVGTSQHLSTEPYSGSRPWVCMPWMLHSALPQYLSYWEG